MQKRIKVCLVSPYSYPLFNPECKGAFGGSEVRVSIIAKRLALNPELDVSLIVFDHGQPEVENIDGVTVYAWKERPGPVMGMDVSNQQQAGNIESELIISTSGNTSKTEFGVIGRLISPLIFRLYRGIKWRVLSLYHGRLVFWRSVKFLNLLYLLVRRPNEFARMYGIDSKLSEAYRSILELDRIGNYSIYKRNLKIYEKVDADLYIIPGNSEITCEAAYFSKKKRKKSILLAGSDMDYDPEYKAKPELYNRYGSPHSVLVYAIATVDVHSVQNERQAELLADHYGRESTIIKNPIDLTPIDASVIPKGDILWVGKSDTIKRPEIILEIVRRMPTVSFTLIMTRSNAEIHASALAAGESLSNVRIIEYVPFKDIEPYFAAHRILINTSTIEGFPNTFLQSIKYGHPVVSLNVDPGAMLSAHGCGGICKGDFEKMVGQVNELLQDNEAYSKTALNCLKYIKEFHDQEMIIGRYVQLIRSITS
jgi:glycosyltransferase involved in cell wall biosynthesis